SPVRGESPKKEEKEKSPKLELPVRKSQRVKKWLESRKIETLESKKGDEDNEECNESQNHPVYDVHESEEEGNEEKDKKKGGAHDKGGSEEVNMIDQKTPTPTK
ncbi:hypothetical protein KI387_021832, partial [Taxus chinensis]